jgi:acylphosphatase
MITIRLVITGKVQGVFYRKSAKEKAGELKITGTVRNLANGDVEIIATGNREQLDNLISWCKTGPPKAVVAKIEIEEQPFQLFNDFSITR